LRNVDSLATLRPSQIGDAQRKTARIVAMMIFDFITQEEIDDLPDDDPRAAFMTPVRIAQRRLGARRSLTAMIATRAWP
jgi:hypothetical protein